MDRSCDDDQTWMVVKPGGKRSKDELREACLLTAKLLPPKVFAKVGPRHPSSRQLSVDPISRRCARAQAISLLAQAVGAVVLSRACPDESALADEILDACRAACHAALAQAATG